MILRGALIGAFGTLAVLAALAVSACGSSKRAGAGDECFVANDCVTPLVCVEQRDKTRICTDNLDSVVGSLPPEAAAPDTGQNAEAGPPAEAGGDTPDTGVTDQ